MKCPLCGHQFREEDGQAACRGCLLAGSCHMVKCPNCGYDIPKETKLIKALKAWRQRSDGTRGKSGRASGDALDPH